MCLREGRESCLFQVSTGPMVILAVDAASKRRVATRGSARSITTTATAPPAAGVKRVYRQKALQREVADLAPIRSYNVTGIKRNTPTALFQEWVAKPVLKVMLKLQKVDLPKPTELRARVAALARWNKLRASGEVAQEQSSEVARLMPSPDESRVWRRGESAYYVGSIRDYLPAELVFWCQAVSERKIKYPEVKQLYESGRIRVPFSTIARWTTGKHKDGWKQFESEKSFKPLGAPPRVSHASQHQHRHALPPPHTHSPLPAGTHYFSGRVCDGPSCST